MRHHGGGGARRPTLMTTSVDTRDTHHTLDTPTLGVPTLSLSCWIICRWIIWNDLTSLAFVLWNVSRLNRVKWLIIKLKRFSSLLMFVYVKHRILISKPNQYPTYLPPTAFIILAITNFFYNYERSALMWQSNDLIFYGQYRKGLVINRISDGTWLQQILRIIH